MSCADALSRSRHQAAFPSVGGAAPVANILGQNLSGAAVDAINNLSFLTGVD